MTGSLLPYDGLRTAEHGVGDGPRTVSTYATDVTGTVTYRFNGLGFRCEPFDPGAKAQIFVCGCSYSVGVGVAQDDIWPERLRRMITEDRGFGVGDVGLMNFSQGGGSDAYITRMLLAQSARVTPDLAVAAFTHNSRTEIYDGERAPTMLQNYATSDLLRKPEFIHGVEAPDHALIDRIKLSAEAYYDFYTPKIGIASALKHMLLFQSWCGARDIPHLSLLMVEEEKVFGGGAETHPSLKMLAELVDRDRVVPVAECRGADIAADGSHPGPRAHALIAERAFAAVQRLYD